MYVVNHYCRVNGRMYTKGEIILELTEEKAAWLVKNGAITEMEPEKQAAPSLPRQDAPKKEPEPVTEPEAEEAEEETEDPEPEDAWEDEEAPEIDVMDGVIAPAEEAPAEKPKRKKLERRKR